jgi:hypothetical protein
MLRGGGLTLLKMEQYGIFIDKYHPLSQFWDNSTKKALSYLFLSMF